MLTERDAHELAKPITHKWLTLFRDDPGNQLQWYPELYDRFAALPKKDLLAGLDDAQVDQAGEHGSGIHLDEIQLASKRAFARAQARYVLDAHGLRVDDYGYLKLVCACAIALQRASIVLAHSYATGKPVEVDEGQLGSGAADWDCPVSVALPHFAWITLRGGRDGVGDQTLNQLNGAASLSFHAKCGRATKPGQPRFWRFTPDESSFP